MYSSTLLRENPKQKRTLLLGFLFSLFLALVWFLLSASAAEAKICPPENVERAICAATPAIVPDQPTISPGKSKATVKFDPNDYNFVVACSDWDGSSSWKLSSNCAVTDANIFSSGNGKQTWGLNGVYVREGTGERTLSSSFPTSYSIFKTCSPSGQKSPYAQTWNLKVQQTFQTEYYWKYNFIIADWESKSRTPVLIGEYALYSGVGCIWPIDDTIEVKCFWNYGGNAYYSIDRNRTASGWDNFGPRPALASDPRTPTGGSGTNAPNCDVQGPNPTVGYGKDVDKLGYYKIYVDYNYRVYKDIRWITTGGTVLYNQWSQGATLAGSSATWWAYSCSAGLPNATEGAYYSQGALPDRDSSLNPANCPQSVWECQLSSPQTIGLDLTSVAAGTTNPTTPVTVMRNGEKIPVTFAKVRVVDQTNNSNTDVTNGAVGGGVKDITNIEYKAEVKVGSTPFYGTNPNDSKQYFKLFRNATSDSTDKWGTWYGNANANINKTLAFVWASEGPKPFVAERNYRVTGSFLVPQGGAINSGSSAGAPQGSEWKVGTYDCLDYDYSSGTRVSNGPLTAYSNDVNVVRSVTDAE